MLFDRRRFMALCPALAGMPWFAQAGESGTAEPVGREVLRRGLQIKISPETTHIVEPLRSDGSVDFALAIDRRLRPGVTPETNAAVALLQAMGPKEITPPHRTALFARLGIAPLADDGQYFTPLWNFLRQREPQGDSNFSERLSLLEDSSLVAPWTRKQFPSLADWLDANHRSLESLVEGMERPHFYWPATIREGDSIQKWLTDGAVFFCISHVREVVKTLARRAMRCCGEGDFKGTARDLRASLRLAWHYAHQPYAVNALVANACARQILECTRSLACGRHLQAGQARQLLEMLSALPPWPAPVVLFDWGERLFALDSAIEALKGTDFWSTREKQPTAWDVIGDPFEPWHRLASDPAGDPHLALQLVNVMFDRCAAALRPPNLSRRRSLARDLAGWEKELQEGRLPASLRQKAETIPSETVIGVLAETASNTTLVGRMIIQDATREMWFDLTRLSLALAVCRDETGRYPATLDALCPKYLKVIPRDIFSDQPLRYRLEADGYLLYSVGENGRDDQGQDARNRPAGAAEEATLEDSPPDDLAVRGAA